MPALLQRPRLIAAKLSMPILACCAEVCAYINSSCSDTFGTGGYALWCGAVASEGSSTPVPSLQALQITALVQLNAAAFVCKDRDTAKHACTSMIGLHSTGATAFLNVGCKPAAQRVPSE